MQPVSTLPPTDVASTRELAARCRGTATMAEDVAWLGEPTDKLCACGAPMRRFEKLNGKCDQCRIAELQAERRKPDEFHERERIGIPPAYCGCTFDSWRGKVPPAIPEWLANPKGFALLTGDPGTGKTHLATATLIAAKADDFWCAWSSARLLPDQLRAEIHNDDRPLYKRLVGCEVLLLDDVGAQRETAFSDERVSTLLDDRFQRAKATIVTTNLNAEQLLLRDQRLASRLLSGVHVALVGIDRRLKR